MTCSPECCNVDLSLRLETRTEEETQTTVIVVQKKDTNSSWAVISNYLEKGGRRIVEVRGDGYCQLYAISENLKEESLANVSSDELCVKLWNKVNNNKQIARTQPKEVLVQIPQTFTPERIRHFPKAPTRRQTTKGRKGRKKCYFDGYARKRL